MLPGWTARESYLAHVLLMEDIATLVNHVANGSGLILDQHPDSYYLIDLVINQMPALVEDMGQARAIASGVAVSGKLESHDQEELAIRIDRVHNAEMKLINNLLIVYAERPAFKEKLSKYGKLASESAESFHQLLSQKLLNVDVITISAQDIFDSSTRAIDSVFVSYDKIMPELAHLISRRIIKQNLNKNITLLLIIGVILLVLLISINFYKALNRFKSTLDLTKDAVLTFEPGDLKFVYVNQAATNLVGYSDDELMQMTPVDITPELNYEKIRNFITPLIEGLDKSVTFETSLKHKSGHLLPAEIMLEYINPRGERGRVSAVVRDTSERNRMLDKVDIYSESAHDVQQRFNLAVEGAGDGAWDWDIENNILTYSRLWMEMLGYSEYEFPHTMETFNRLVHPDDIEAIQQRVQDYLTGDVPDYIVEMRMLCKDGQYKWILSRGKIVARDDTGKPLRMTGIHSDISTRKNDEEYLKIFRRIFDSAEQSIAVADIDGHYLYLNKGHEKLLGVASKELLGQNFSRFVSKETELILQSKIEKMFTEGTGWSGIIPLLHSDGTELVALVNIGFISGDNGKPQYLFNIMSDYSDELQRQQQLTDAKEVAEKANLAKSEFLSSMSHELRTPMNAILGFSQLMEYDDSLSEDSRDSVNEILKAGNHLLSLINEVLDLAKIESGSIDMSIEAVDLTPIVHECMNLISTQAEKQEIKVSFSGVDDAVVRADHIRLKQVLLNLLSNAIKYNRKGGDVKIELHQVNDLFLRISVLDTGLGIPAKSLDELFKPFNRLDAEGSDIEGTGIGLTITRRIVDMMGGNVGVESTMGVGSHFWIDLPVDSLPHSGKKPTVEASEDVVTHGDDMTTHTVLYIEDNPSNLRLVAQLFAKHKHIHLITAHTPELGINLARARDPDLILLDINMPGMNGYQVLETLKLSESLQTTPVVAITANAMPRDIERGMAAGFCEYLTKPLNVEKFYQVIEQELNSKRNTANET